MLLEHSRLRVIVGCRFILEHSTSALNSQVRHWSRSHNWNCPVVLSGLQQVRSGSLNPSQIRRCDFLMSQLIFISPLNYLQKLWGSSCPNQWLFMVWNLSLRWSPCWLRPTKTKRTLCNYLNAPFCRENVGLINCSGSLSESQCLLPASWILVFANPNLPCKTLGCCSAIPTAPQTPCFVPQRSLTWKPCSVLGLLSAKAARREALFSLQGDTCDWGHFLQNWAAG